MLNVHFLPYGRVDAILIGCDGQWAFMDSGFRADGVKAVEYMRGLGITKLNAYIASHRHRNHVGGAPYIIRQMRPDVIYTADSRMKDRLWSLAKGSAEREAIHGTPVKVLENGDFFMIGNSVIKRIGPIKLQTCSAGALAENANSMILRVSYGERTMLLTGDTSSSVLRAIDRKGKFNIWTEVLKNPHHGGNLPLSTLEMISPDITVLCTNKKCSISYNKRLARAGCESVYTATKGDSGAVIVSTEGSAWTVITTRKDGKKL